MPEEYRLDTFETVKRSMYGDKTDDYGELYMEEVIIFTFKNGEAKELKLSLSREDIEGIYYTLKNANF